MDWIEIKSGEEIKDLLNTFGWFHDGCLREIHLWNSYYVDDDLGMGCGDYTLNAKVLFQRQFENPSAIEVYFSDIQRMNIVSTPQDYWYSILGVTLEHIDGIFYWADEEDWNISDSNNDNVMWISSKGIKWRDRSEYMGNKLRYGQID
jgi:hypothetical protein